MGVGAYGAYAKTWNDRNELYWISITDSPTLSIPRPPYTLDEKNNEIYGYIKQSE